MVISTAPVQEDWDDLCRATGIDLQPPSSPYWAGRHGFDAGDLSPEAYWVLADLHVAPEDVVFIDDSPANNQVAEALGIRVVLHTEDTDLGQELALLADPA
ncbi:hypothetical protein H9638_03460 [Arthrobacter sp. Sa2BUA2]|uniref:HAD family hydrolase n=2 Tax=Arthrobacter pullicola TaxID=2762224 RepID=A0ABR8YF90_9MICC|nr:hypothetical protein [Arthrobacter pullicola]